MRSVVNDDLSVGSVESYAPFGTPLEPGSFGSPFMFTGEPLDANGLLYLRARYYNPALGVFTSLDPVENLNRYAYVNGDPINTVDPSGMIGERPIGLDCHPQQVDECEFNDCHAQYLAHAAISETTSNYGDFISYSAMAALMLTSINYAGGGTNFYSLESIRRWLNTNTNPNYPDIPATLEGQGQARDEYMSRCQSDPTQDMGTFSMSEINRNALTIARAIVWGLCRSTPDPLAAFDAHRSEYWPSTGYNSPVLSSLDLPTLRRIRDNPGLKDEFGFHPKALDAFREWEKTWKESGERRLLEYLMPSQENYLSRIHIFFAGPNLGLLISDDNDPLHVNWQCWQEPDGDPIVWLVTSSLENPVQNKTGCIPCRIDDNTVWWTELCGAMRMGDWRTTWAEDQRCGRLKYVKECESIR